MPRNAYLDHDIPTPTDRLTALLAEAVMLADQSGLDLAAIRIEEAISLARAHAFGAEPGDMACLH